MSQAPLYRIENVGFYYHLGSQKVQALKDISCEVREGAFLCLMGPSGSGKSTLLNLLGLIEPVQSGKIEMGGRNVSRLGETPKNEIRKTEIGFVFQAFNLFPVFTAEENVDYYLARRHLAPNERAERVRQALESVGLWEHRKKRPLEMSGGQRQRVAIARALAKKPKIIIADEPTASLDQKTGHEVMRLFQEANVNTGAAIIVSSHDPMVQAICPEKLSLRDGVLV